MLVDYGVCLLLWIRPKVEGFLQYIDQWIEHIDPA